MLSDGDIGAIIAELENGALLASCIDWVCAEAKKCSDVSKLCALIDILAACSGLRSIFAPPCIKYMTITLSHRLPRVRLIFWLCGFEFDKLCRYALTALIRSTRHCLLLKHLDQMHLLRVKFWLNFFDAPALYFCAASMLMNCFRGWRRRRRRCTCIGFMERWNCRSQGCSRRGRVRTQNWASCCRCCSCQESKQCLTGERWRLRYSGARHGLLNTDLVEHYSLWE